MTTILQVNRYAITFIELLFVIIIIGILLTVSLPQLKRASDDFELESFVKDIYYLSLYLQEKAISEEKIHCLNINQGHTEFWATYNKEGQFEALKERFGKIYKVPSGISVSLGPPDKTAIYLYPDGSLDSITIIFINRQKRQISLISQGALGEIKVQ